MAVMNRRSNIKQQPQQCASVRWQLGDIAFLKSAEGFCQIEREELLESGRVHSSATGHPVIILDRSKDGQYYIVTTVSAYGSGEHNKYLPPWGQSSHKRKDINGFRAFEGSARPNDEYQHLRLANGKLWPKFRTSWVYIHSLLLVPASTLIEYDKPRCQLRMAPESLQDLLSHVQAKERRFREQKAKMDAETVPVAKSSQINWRRDGKEQVSQAPQSPVKTNDMVNRNHQQLSSQITIVPSKSCSNATLGRIGLDDANTAGSKPLWSAVVAKSTNTAPGSRLDAGLEQTSLNNTSTTGSKPGWYIIVAKSINKATSTACNAHVQPRSWRSQDIVQA
ncbi:hypothetical protein GQX73_g5601 [Xylaria multiplex]|uniref:Uncharacterized protein n=1 Tax=Xylaria multiplex TaxID=323545 RepID=A0A7C8MRV9_9PEZI|nr:hypothetical protein GQX73_g5601 [Xylaria multiplex]